MTRRRPRLRPSGSSGSALASRPRGCNRDPTRWPVDGLRTPRAHARILKRKRNPGLIPYELTLPNGRRITAIDVTEVVISFPDAQALEPNLSFVERMVDEGVAFQVFDPLGHPHIIRSIGDLQSFQQLIGHQTTVIPCCIVIHTFR